MSFIVKFCVARHQFHVFQTFLHRKRLESLFNTAYSVVKAGKPFSDYELICEIQVKNGLDLGENYRNINGCKTFATSIA